MRQIIVAIVVGAAGAAAGALGVYTVKQAETEALKAEAAEYAADARKLVEAAEAESQARIAALEEELEKTKARLYERDDALAALEDTATGAQQRLREMEQAALASMAEEGEDDTDVSEEEDAAEVDDGRRRGWGDMTEEQRREMGQRFRSGANEFLEEEIAYAPDEVTQSRLIAMSDGMNRMFDLREQIRAAETDEARAALDEEMDLVRDSLDELRTEQQNDMLRNLAAANGIDNPKQVNRFMRDMKATLDSPFFRFGGGPPGRGGGRGPRP